MRLRKRPAALLFGLSLLLLPLLWLWLAHGVYGFNVLLRRGGSFWATVPPTDGRLSPAMRLALQEPPPEIRAGALLWQEIEAGFEMAELPVLAGDQEVDRIFLYRVAPDLFRFSVRNASSGAWGIDDWARQLPDAVLIVNGSYYDGRGLPDTPVISEGAALGPRQYQAHGGAFVAGDGFARLEDLRDKDWPDVFAGARNAMVSYPLLIGQDGETHVAVGSNWLANRTFLGQDASGRIIIGTTRDAFFSLQRLGAFLKSSPLKLVMALNLDGGPVACEAVNIGPLRGKLYAQWEAQTDGHEVRLLRWPRPNATWALPMVLAIERRSSVPRSPTP